MAVISFHSPRKFFDDANFPRGFARSGDFTIKEAELLTSCGLALRDLEAGTRAPQTDEESAFVAVCKGEREAQAPIEKAWLKYRARIANKRRSFSLVGSGDVGEEDGGVVADDDL